MKFLVFSGAEENEGNFYILETNEEIIILSAGKSYYHFNTEKQKNGQDYLKKKKDKISSIIINNTSYKNIEFLEELYKDINKNIPIYTSYINEIILSNKFPSLKNKIIKIEKNKKIEKNNFSLYFFFINSYMIGNMATIVICSEYIIYFFDNFVSNSLLNNKLLFDNNFFFELNRLNFFHKEKKKYLITNCYEMHLNSNNSLLLLSKFFFEKGFPIFFILYEFDWLHILELLKIIKEKKIKIKILNDDFLYLIKKILNKEEIESLLTDNFDENNKNFYLLICNPNNIDKEIKEKLIKFSFKNIEKFHFIIGIFPIIKGEEKIAKLIDYLYTKSKKITNLGKTKYLKLGLNFHDLKLLIKIIKPNKIITLQNTHKNKIFFQFFSDEEKIITFNKNLFFFDFFNQKISKILYSKEKKNLLNLEGMLIEQRENLGQNGLLLLFIIGKWENEKLKLKKIKIDNLSVSSGIFSEKLEEKIINWWEKKIIFNIEKNEPFKLIKKIINRRLNELLKSYLNLKLNIKLKETFFIFFID